MEGSSSRENGSNNNEDTAWEVRPGGMLVQKRDDDGVDVEKSRQPEGLNHGGGGPINIKIKVSYGSIQLDLSVPSDSTFGDLKRIISQEIGLEPKLQKLLFRGTEKDDHDHLHMAGVKDSSKILVMENTPIEKEKVEEVKTTIEISIGEAAVAEVRAEVDKLSEQVSALEAVIYGGTMVDEKNILYLTEMLMRQLLKLDGIEAQGEGKVQRKMEVRRVQSFVDTMDILKARNSNPVSHNSNSVSVTTRWETFDSGVGSLNPPAPSPTSAKANQDWERFE